MLITPAMASAHTRWMRTAQDLYPFNKVYRHKTKVDSITGKAGSICSRDTIQEDSGVLGGGAAEIKFFVFAGVGAYSVDHDAGLFIQHIAYRSGRCSFQFVHGQ